METPQATTVMDLDWVMQELGGSPEKLPVEALRAAQANRELITPLLIHAIEDATATLAAGGKITGDITFFGLFLLAEFRAQEAWPAILNALSLPGEEGPFDLFGDAITNGLDRMLAGFCADAPHVLDAMVANQSLNEYVRWAAAAAYLYLVRDGRLSREDAINRLTFRLHSAMQKRDSWGVTICIDELLDFGAGEALDDVRTAYRLHLADDSICDQELAEELLAAGEAGFQDALENCEPAGIDTVAELSQWSGYQEDRESWCRREDAPASYEFARPTQAETWMPPPRQVFAPSTIVNTRPRVGRNDPCPCGSGRKFKKCCGAS